MTAVAYPLPYMDPPAIQAEPRPASQIGQTLADMTARTVEYTRNNASDWRPLTNALIEQLAHDCRGSDWDGYGAQPISTRAKEQAQYFVGLLPYQFPAPDPTPDPDGEMALSWDFGPGRVFNVSIDADGTLSYAGLLGPGVKRHGMERLGSEVPRIILRSIEELCERARPVA